MDWYFRKDSDDLTVPSDQESSDMRHADDRSPYPDICFQWEVGKMENFVPLKKFVSRSMKPVGAGLNFNSQNLSENFELESSVHYSKSSSNQRAYGDLSLVDRSARTLEAFSQKHDHLDDEQMDDLWDSVFIEDPSDVKNLSDSPDSAYRSMSFGNLLTDMLMDPRDSLKAPSFMGSMDCAKGSFILTDDVAEEEDQMEYISPSLVTDNSKSSEGSPTASVLSVLVPAELTASEVVGHVQEKKYLEATVLQELEDVMSQLNMETRICFRDALYRLAKISERHRSFIKNKPSLHIDGESSCHGSSKSAEAKTNAIDRTVANLMFNKPDSSPPFLPSPRRGYQYAEPCQYPGSYSDISNQPSLHRHHHHPTSPQEENNNCSHSISGASCLSLQEQWSIFQI